MTRPSRLLPRSARLFGRDRELAALGAAIASSGSCTVVGPAGSGKTELLLHFVAARGDDDAALCDLIHARDEEGVLVAIARALSVPLRARDGDRGRAAVIRALAARRSMLVLDGCEHVRDEVASLLEGIDRRAPIVCGSRVPIGTSDERTIALGPLFAPEDARHAAPSEAVELFVERARRVAPAFTPTSSDVQVVATICRRLDGLPRAIELVAPHVDGLSPKAILARVERFLESMPAPREGLHRPRALLAALASSWELLSPEEKAALAQASVFEGAFSIEAVERVVDASPGVARLDVVQGLVARALLRAERTAYGEARFALHRTLRAYAAETLDDDARKAALRRHARYFAAAATERARAIDGPHGEHARAWLDDVLLDLLAAHATALVDPELPSDVACALSLAMEAPILSRGPSPSDLDRLEATLARAGSSASPALLGRLRVAKGLMAQALGSAVEAARELEDARSRARASGDRALEARALCALGELAFGQGAFDVASTSFEEAIERCASLDAPHLAGKVLRGLGATRRARGAHDEASRLFERALVAMKRGGGARGEAILAGELGILRLDQGRLDEARALLEEALATLGALRLRSLTAPFLAALGGALHEAGELARARACFEEAIDEAEATGELRVAAKARLSLAALALEIGEIDLARREAEAALASVEGGADRGAVAEAHAILGAVLATRDERAAAERAFAASAGSRAALVHARHLELARARALRAAGDEEGARAAESRAREELHALDTHEARVAMRLLRHAFERDVAALLVVARDTSWVRAPGGLELRFDRKPTLRRLLESLVRARVEAPGRALSPDELVAAGWPGERLPKKVALDRLHVSLQSLRKLGLRSCLVVRGDGAMLDPSIPVEVVT